MLCMPGIYIDTTYLVCHTIPKYQDLRKGGRKVLSTSSYQISLELRMTTCREGRALIIAIVGERRIHV